jgi:LDH2 family malate/lactate/ureidoglycolate dehydrogenase
MATSAMTFYGLILANAKGGKIPENMAIDSDGNPTIDPSLAMDGALLSFDRSYKGSGIAMVVEMMAGPLVGAAYGQLEGEWGSLIIAIDPELLIDALQFKNNASDLVKKIKSSRKKAGVNEIRIPGENARKTYLASEQSGEVDIDEAILRQLGYTK